MRLAITVGPHYRYSGTVVPSALLYQPTREQILYRFMVRKVGIRRVFPLTHARFRCVFDSSSLLASSIEREIIGWIEVKK